MFQIENNVQPYTVSREKVEATTEVSLKISREFDIAPLPGIWLQCFTKYVFLDNDGVETK